MLDNAITMVGNLTDDPQLRVTTGGVAVTSFRLACSRRVFDRATGQWRDGDVAFFTVTAWRQLAQNAHSSLRKGDRAVVIGRVRQTSYVREGERRSRQEIEADSIGAELSWSCAQVQRTRRQQAEPVGTAGTGESAGETDVTGVDEVAELAGGHVDSYPGEPENVDDGPLAGEDEDLRAGGPAGEPLRDPVTV